MKRILLFLSLLPLTCVLLHAQKVVVSGIITSATDDSPLPGANVVIKGTTTGIITDLDGKFSMAVPPDAILVFSFIGHENHEEAVGGRTQINVTLMPDIITLSDVVVVGYGTMKRTDLTGAVATVSSEIIEQSATTSVDQVLQGRAAGVQVQQNSGAPGSSTSIRIRGISSINGSNEPIFVIDGIIIDGNTESDTDNPLSSINPSDIESVDILKDASATAIYGSRAANGVIMITTKSGKEGRAKITYDGYLGWQEMPKKLDVLNLREYAEHKNTRSAMGIVDWDDNFVNPELLGEGTDWQDEMFTKAAMQSHSLSVSGGTEKTNYSLGMGYLDQEGIAIGSGFNRLSIRGNLNSNVTNYLKTGINFAVSDSKQETSVTDDDLIKIALKQTPNVAVRNAYGEYDGPETDQYVQSNPVGLAMLKENNNQKNSFRATTYAELTILNGLTFKTEYAVDYGFSNYYTFTPSYTFGAIENTTRESSRTKNTSKYWAWRNVLTYNKSIGVHQITGMLGQELQHSAWESLYAYRSGFLSNGATDLDLGDSQTSTNSNNSNESALSSFFGRAFYAYNDKYLLTATVRRDGSSKFIEDYQWGWFPSVALAWKISNEEFMAGTSLINNLKLRIGWGMVGNENIPSTAYSYTSTYAAVETASWGTALIASNTANPDLHWETTQSSNIGVDFNMFSNRIEFVGDLYYKKTNDLLLELPLPAYVGTDGQGSTSPPWKNIGSLENKGIELTLNTVNVDRGGFFWRSNFVFSINRNKVLSLDTETSIVDEDITEGSETTIVTRTAVGKPIGQYYGYEVIGRFNKATDFYYKDEDGNVQAVALPEDMEIGENSVWIGDYIFKDQLTEDTDGDGEADAGDGVIDENDRAYIGNPEPKFTYGIGNTFSYKGFDLNIFITGVYGNQLINYQRRFLENSRNNHNLLKIATEYAQLGLIDEAGPDDDFRNIEVVGGDPYMPRIGASSASSTSNFRYSDRFVEDGSYLRIQNISLAYTLPIDWVSKIYVQRMKIYATVQNLYTFTKYSGYDPEVGATEQNVLLTGIDNARYPMPRTYTFGINVTF